MVSYLPSLFVDDMLEQWDLQQQVYLTVTETQAEKSFSIKKNHK